MPSITIVPSLNVAARLIVFPDNNLEIRPASNNTKRRIGPVAPMSTEGGHREDAGETALATRAFPCDGNYERLCPS